MDERLAIAASSGGFKCVFIHGVLAALEERGIGFEAIGAASASGMPALFAACGTAAASGVDYWRRGLEVRTRPGNGMSEMILAGIAHYLPALRDRLFAEHAPRVVIATSRLIGDEAIATAQGDRASRLGRQLLLDMAKGDSGWVDEHLRSVLFDSMAEDPEVRLTPENVADVLYASSRMLHAWRLPAWVEGKAYIDASYTLSNPAEAMAAPPITRVIAIGTEPGRIDRNLFRDRSIPLRLGDTSIETIVPAFDLASVGVDFTTATVEGLERAYDHGREVGMAISGSGRRPD